MGRLATMWASMWARLSGVAAMAAEIFAVLQKAAAVGHRSSALGPLLWMISLMGTAMLAAISIAAPTWVVGMLAAFLGIAILVTMGCYVYLMITDPGALRSERFHIQRMALERSLKGDDLTGLMAIESDDQTKIGPPNMEARGT